ncbi:predicted protein [Naegleria gruberi]|uniref:Predicted protein n=1 Tax=Naegleria gruberi TaxID=5762 RepID=D2VZ20_NAEGR|nr:uncharacterized protein NAEGRDRAFT_74325 [Naegleria gruberi]EFC37913.1 predicted protein [Naegleria gruberi]|eukprot:XP_002670657.1 predicted protein [Naegleria gruberi strain NEG-M]
MKKLQNGIVGIDFGGSHCRAAVYIKDHIEYIPNKFGKYETPTCLAFLDESSSSSVSESKILIGQEALEYSLVNPHCCFWDFKKLIGKTFHDDDEFSSQERRWPFKIIRKEDGTIRLGVINGELSISEMIGLILKELKQDAERYLNTLVTEIIVSIPNYYSNCQRIIMKKAGEYAGLKIARFIHDTSASCFQYLWKEHGERRVFLFDLGRSGCSASIMIVESDIFETRTSEGFSNVGGSLLDESLVNYCCEQFYKSFKKHLQENPISMRRLNLACEEAKKRLSNELETKISLESLMDGNDFEITISRSLFEELNIEFFRKCMNLVTRVHTRSLITKQEIDHVIFVGGGGEIPKLKELISNYFGKTLYPKPLLPYEVAFGVAFEGGILGGFEQECLIIDTTSRPITCEMEGNMLTIFPTEVSIPCIKVSQLLISDSIMERKTFQIKIFEGDRPESRELIGIATIDIGIDLTSNRLETRFEFDVNGILSIMPFSNTLIKSNWKHISSC